MTSKNKTVREPRSLSIHLVDDVIGETRRCRRGFLVFMMFTAYVGLWYSMNGFLSDYMSNPYVVTTKIVHPTSYPEITFCPGFTADLNKLEAQGLRIEHYWDLMGFFYGNHDAKVHMQRLSQGAVNATNVLQIWKEIDDILVKRNISITELILELSVGVKDVWNNTAASIETGGSSNTTVSGPIFNGYGLCFSVDFAVYELNEFTASFTALPLVINQISWPGDENWGYFPRTDYLFVGERSKSLYPTPVYRLPRNGFNADIHIYATHMQRRQGCVHASYIEHFRCLINCINVKCIEKKLCTMSLDTNFADLSYRSCNSFRNRTCMIGQEPLVATNCTEGCPPSCSEWIHDLSIFPLPTSKKELTVLTFSYSSGLSTYSLEERYIYSWHGFLAGFGGQLSLWCGMSVLSVPQVILYVWDFFLGGAVKKFLGGKATGSIVVVQPS